MRTGPGRAAAWACLAGALVSASTGCADAPRAAAPDVEALGLSAVAVYGRHAAVRGKVDIRLANSGPAAVEVVTVQLRSPLYEQVPAGERPATLPADGRARIVPVPFGGVRCGVEGTDRGEVVLGVRTPDGVRDVAVPLADGEPGLVRAHRLACAAADVAETAVLQLGPAWSREPGPDGPRLRTTLHAERFGTAGLAVTELLGNILFEVTVPSVPSGAPVLDLPAGQPKAAVEVLVAATRCDPHALTESKTSFTFPLFAQVDGAEPVAAPLTVTGVGRDALQALLDETCGAG